jgi:hypothetical protein
MNDILTYALVTSIVIVFLGCGERKAYLDIGWI